MPRVCKFVLILTLSGVLVSSSSTSKANPVLAEMAKQVAVNVISQLISAFTTNFMEKNFRFGQSRQGFSQKEYAALKKLMDTYSLQRDYIQAVDKYSSGRTLVWDSETEVGNGFQDLIYAWKKSLHGFRRARGIKRYPWDVLLIKIGITLKKAIHKKRPTQYKSTIKEIDATLSTIAFWWGKSRIFHKLVKRTKTRYRVLFENPFEKGMLVVKRLTKRSYLIKSVQVWVFIKSIQYASKAIYKEHSSKLEAMHSLGQEVRKYRLSVKFRKKVVNLLSQEYKSHIQMKLWPNGHFKSYVLLKKGKRDGVYREWDSVGGLLTKGSFLLGKKQGLWKGYWPRGVGNRELTVRYSGHFANGLKSQTWSWYYRSGQLRYQASYKRGLLHGPEKSWDENGKLRFVASYKAGKANGKFQGFQADGKKRSEKLYSNGMLLREWVKKTDKLAHLKTWHPNGKVKAIATMYKFHKSGVYREWYRNGKLKVRHNYSINGRLEGKQYEWHSNGKMAAIESYQSGKPVGVFKYWYSNGKLRRYMNYVDGKLHGLFVNLNKKEQPKVEKTYSHGSLLTRLTYLYTASGRTLKVEHFQGKKRVISRTFAEKLAPTQPSSKPAKR